MTDFLGFLVIALGLAVLAYFKVPKFKELVDTKLFKRPAKPSEPVLATPTYTAPQKPAVEAVVKPETPNYAPPGTVPSTSVFYPDPAVKPAKEPAATVSTTPTKNFYFPPTIVQLSAEPAVKIFAVPAGFTGLCKISWTSAPSGYDDAAEIEVAVSGPNGLIYGPIKTQYTGGAISLCTPDRYMFGYLPLLRENTDFYVNMRSANVPTAIVFQVNGTHFA